MRYSSMALLSLCLAAAAQVPDAHAPAFEVASIKPAANPGMVPMFCLVPCSPGERLTFEGGRVDIRYMSLSRLILTAYRLKPYQLSGADWMKTQRFDILAKVPAERIQRQHSRDAPVAACRSVQARDPQ